MCHVCGFICYLCVELKLMINTRSLSNQALKSAHPSLLSSRCWPWGVFIGAGQPLQHGEVRDTYITWREWGLCLNPNSACTWNGGVWPQPRFFFSIGIYHTYIYIWMITHFDILRYSCFWRFNATGFRNKLWLWCISVYSYHKQFMVSITMRKLNQYK